MSKIRLKKKKLAIIVVILLLLVGATVVALTFLNKKESKSEEPRTEEKEPKEEVKKLKIVDENSTSRPYAIMINNIGVARPLQSGLQDAYIIYEFIVEGGLTRYMALFLDQKTERIGSIRSARHYFIDYALENDAIYVHHGKSPQAQADFGLLKGDRIEVDNTGSGWRDKSLNVAYEHTLFTNIEKLNSVLGKKRTTRNKDLLLNYSVDSLDLKSIPNSKDANNVSIKYSKSVTSSYEYDSEAKVYKRSVNGKEHVDYVTKEQYTFKNIIAYSVKNTRIAGDAKDRQTIDNIGKGKGVFISEGVAVPITWEKTSRSAQTIYKLEDGTKLTVNDGNTFIQVYPTDGSITIS